MSSINKRISVFCVAVLLLFNELSYAKTNQPLIAITQFINHPSLDKIRSGITDELKYAGYIDGKNCRIIFDNAQGDMAIATQIAQKFISLLPSVIIAITTPSAQIIKKAIKGTSIPMVFGAVTDPVNAHLVQTLDGPYDNVAGTIDYPSPADQVKEMLKIVPSIKTLAIAYNPSETNSSTQVKELKNVLQAEKIKYIEVPIFKSADVSTSLYANLIHADALFIPNDNLVISALEAILTITNSQSIPVFTSDPESVSQGALAATANDQYIIGRETGKLVVHILNGRNVNELGIKKITSFKTYINKNSEYKINYS